MSGGWLMVPLAAFSVLALAICINRFWVLATGRVMPSALQGALIVEKSDDSALQAQQRVSPLGEVAAVLLGHRESEPELASAALDDALTNQIHGLERYLTTLGTIASISPLLGLLGTVLGMIDVFTALNQSGAREPSVFAGGIGEALITTAVGLCIAIPSLICHRHFQRRVDEYALQLERQGKLWLGELFTNHAT